MAPPDRPPTKTGTSLGTALILWFEMTIRAYPLAALVGGLLLAIWGIEGALMLVVLAGPFVTAPLIGGLLSCVAALAPLDGGRERLAFLMALCQPVGFVLSWSAWPDRPDGMAGIVAVLTLVILFASLLTAPRAAAATEEGM